MLSIAGNLSATLLYWFWYCLHARLYAGSVFVGGTSAHFVCASPQPLQLAKTASLCICVSYCLSLLWLSCRHCSALLMCGSATPATPEASSHSSTLSPLPWRPWCAPTCWAHCCAHGRRDGSCCSSSWGATSSLWTGQAPTEAQHHSTLLTVRHLGLQI